MSDDPTMLFPPSGCPCGAVQVEQEPCKWGRSPCSEARAMQVGQEGGCGPLLPGACG